MNPTHDDVMNMDMWLSTLNVEMARRISPQFVGRDEKRAPLKTPAWEARRICAPSQKSRQNHRPHVWTDAQYGINVFRTGAKTIRYVSTQPKGDVTRDDSQQRILAQHSFTALLRHCFEWLPHCCNTATLSCAENRRYKSSRVTLPWKFFTVFF